MTKKRVTEAKVRKLTEVVRKAYHAEGETELVYRMDWDWPGEPTPTILWEGGPYDWAIECHEVRLAAEAMGLFVEPYAGYALCVYPGWA